MLVVILVDGLSCFCSIQLLLRERDAFCGGTARARPRGPSRVAVGHVIAAAFYRLQYAGARDIPTLVISSFLGCAPVPYNSV